MAAAVSGGRARFSDRGSCRPFRLWSEPGSSAKWWTILFARDRNLFAVDVPQILFLDRVMDILAVCSFLVHSMQTVQKTVEFPRPCDHAAFVPAV